MIAEAAVLLTRLLHNDGQSQSEPVILLWGLLRSRNNRGIWLPKYMIPTLVQLPLITLLGALQQPRTLPWVSESLQTMERLPQELLRLLLENVKSSRDLQAIRLVNKALAAAANPFLFRTIPVWLSLRSLQSLTFVSEHSELASYVHTIVRHTMVKV